jgi:hypothetical protein
LTKEFLGIALLKNQSGRWSSPELPSGLCPRADDSW